jgi:hypothetical protein
LDKYFETENETQDVEMTGHEETHQTSADLSMCVPLADNSTMIMDDASAKNLGGNAVGDSAQHQHPWSRTGTDEEGEAPNNLTT